jgi:hypothetical protein
MKDVIENSRRLPLPALAGSVVLAGVLASTFVKPVQAMETLAERTEREDIAVIEHLLAEGKCASAVNAVKAGLAAKKPHAMLMMGNLYEEGICVKQDWDRAAGLYMRAEESGHRFALSRLAAAYARTGRDNGMALWWAAKGGQRSGFPSQCIPAADPEKDPDGFNAGLESMPPATFQACVYLVGVVNEIMSQPRYPWLALHNNVAGTFQMHFMPATGTVTWNVLDFEVDEEAGGGYRDLAVEGLENPRKIRSSLLDYMNAKSKFALTRYTRPEGGLPADYTYKLDYKFTIER